MLLNEPFLSYKIKSQFSIWITCLRTEEPYVIPVPQTKHNLLPNLQIPKKTDSYSEKDSEKIFWQNLRSGGPALKQFNLKNPEHFALVYNEPPFVCSGINSRAVSIPNQNNSLTMARRYLQQFSLMIAWKDAHKMCCTYIQ